MLRRSRLQPTKRRRPGLCRLRRGKVLGKPFSRVLKNVEEKNQCFDMDSERKGERGVTESVLSRSARRRTIFQIQFVENQVFI